LVGRSARGGNGEPFEHIGARDEGDDDRGGGELPDACAVAGAATPTASVAYQSCAPARSKASTRAWSSAYTLAAQRAGWEVPRGQWVEDDSTGLPYPA
jgi:hypothetical protein